jgi:hypothetical protein
MDHIKRWGEAVIIKGGIRTYIDSPFLLAMNWASQKPSKINFIVFYF